MARITAAIHNQAGATYDKYQQHLQECYSLKEELQKQKQVATTLEELATVLTLRAPAQQETPQLVVIRQEAKRRRQKAHQLVK